MNRELILALAAVAMRAGPLGAAAEAAPGPAKAPPPPSTSAAATIPKFTGSVGPKNAGWLLDRVSGRVDKIVGLQIRIEPSSDSDFKKAGYLVDATSEPFSLTKVAPNETDGGVEMVAPRGEVNWLHGAWVIDGFYLVKSGGVHQGTVSIGLEKVSEAQVLLSPKFRIVPRPVPATGK